MDNYKDSLIHILLKAIWIPSLTLIFSIGLYVAILMFKEMGWDVPFKWLFVIGFAAIMLDMGVKP